MSKRILHVTECYAGGVRRAIDTITSLTPEYENHLLHSGDEEPIDNGAYASIAPLPSSIIQAVRTVRERTRELQPDFIYAHSSWAGVFTRVTRVDAPVVYAPHCFKFDDMSLPTPVRSAIRLAEKALARRTHCVIALSPHEDALARSLRPGLQTHYLPNAASVAPSESHPSVEGATGRDVIMIGRLSKQKSPEFFAEVARIVHADAPDIRFRWIGDGEPRANALLASVGVEVTGWLMADDLSAELSRPSLYLHTAAYEGFPLSILDAAAFGHSLAVRSIPAFDGLGIPSADSPEGAAKLVLDILSGGPNATAARDSAVALRATMSHEAQRSSLLALYAAA